MKEFFAGLDRLLDRIMPDQRFVIALLVMTLFLFAYSKNPDDKIMLGAIISSLNIAVGYYLASSKGAKDANEQNRRQSDQLVDLAKDKEPPK